MVAAIVPEHIVAQVMTSALVPNMGYRMECRPATEEEIYQLEQNRPPLPERSVCSRTISGVSQQLVVVGHGACRVPSVPCLKWRTC